MERFKLRPDQAFAVLAGTAQARGSKLSQIAAMLCESGELPPSPSTRAAARNSHNR